MKKFLILLGFITVITLNTSYAKTINLSYAVYGSGFHVLEADVTIMRTDGIDYAINAWTKTHGMLGWLAPWEGTLTTTGSYTKPLTYIPAKHAFIATFRDETETTIFTFDKNGQVINRSEQIDDNPVKNSPINAELTENSTDLLTTVVKMLETTETNDSCNYNDYVYDGKRRFQINYADKRRATIKPNKYSIFSGEALVCTVSIKPAGGKWHDKPRGWLSIQEQGRKKGTLPEIWLGRMNDTGPIVPVKIFVKSDYGALIMHLREMETTE